VPAQVVDGFGAGKKPRVLVTIGGYTYRSSVAVYSGDFMIALSAANREAAGVKAGDTIEVDIQLDTGDRTVVVPDDLAVALAGSPGARESFDALSYTNRRERVDAVDGAKRVETRQRRIARIVEDLT
jgi:hypothetical protein